MGFREAFTPLTEEQEKRINEKLERIKEQTKRECLELGFTENEIEDASKAHIEDYMGVPNFVTVPDSVQYMKYEYEKSPNRTVFESEPKSF